MNWHNDFAKLLGVDYPLIQAPMFGVTTAEMVAAAAKANCLGSLALGDLSADESIKAIRATRALTNKPFAVNIFVHELPAPTPALEIQYGKMKASIEQLVDAHRLSVSIPDFNDLQLRPYQDQVEALIAEDCKMVSFTFGNLDQEAIASLKNRGCLLMGTCTSVEEALILEQSGIDMIVVQGIEAGGHRGSFATEEIPLVGGLSLLAHVYDRVKVPLIYAGGLYDGKTLHAAQVLGAKGFQVGSMLLTSAESALKPFEKERLRHAKAEDIILTKSFSGRYARGLRNAFTEALADSSLVLPYPYQNKLTASLRKAAKERGDTDFVSLWVGQSLPKFDTGSTTVILQHLIEEVARFC